MSKIRLETHINAPPELVFDLARDIDLHQRSTAATGERAIAGVTSGMVELGSRVTWRAKHFGVWQELTVEITEFDRPEMFVDEMVNGAFRSMRHVHRFFPAPRGTTMVDEFEFTAPFGILGRIVDMVALGPYMRRFLRRRNAVLKAIAQEPSSGPAR